MKIILSAATSQDGYLDDATPQRRIFSCPRDIKEVARLRASADAILVGAETIRKDDPSLITRGRMLAWSRKRRGKPRDPMKVTLTASGALDPDSRFFRDGEGQKVVYTTQASCKNLAPYATIVQIEGIPEMLADLERRGVQTLMVEGGGKILQQFLELGIFDEFRLAVAPVTVADARAPCLCRGTLAMSARAVRKESCGTMEVIHFAPSIKV